MARAFARRLGLIGQGLRYVTDKTPGNYHVLGLLALLFPQGKIVHIARNPMDTCFSILQSSSMIARRIPATSTCSPTLRPLPAADASMARGLFGGEFITVEYEDWSIARLGGTPYLRALRTRMARRLSRVHAAPASVRTFSAPQVRRPIYQSSVGAWREFRVELAPLRRALQAQEEPIS